MSSPRAASLSASGSFSALLSNASPAAQLSPTSIANSFACEIDPAREPDDARRTGAQQLGMHFVYGR